MRIWSLLLTTTLACLSATAGQPPIPFEASKDGKTHWYDIRHLGVEGRGFDDTKEYYDRLPARAEGVVRSAVWSLSRNSAGMSARFVTDATDIKARWELTSSRLGMDHMPPTGVSGLDLYVKMPDGKWHWLGFGRPRKYPVSEGTLAAGILPGKREYLLYLPLYNGVKKVELGLPRGTTISRAAKYPESRAKPIVFYGTSITHGACASRPGMAHPSILGRRFHRPIVNLGFSGNGRMEMEVARFIAEIDAAVYVLDCLPNIDAKAVEERTEPLVKFLRKKHPTTPILLVEDRNYSNAFLMPGKKKRNETSQAALRKALANLKAAGITGLWYLEGKNLLGDDNEGTVDSSHPTDLGFMRQADAFEAVLRKILN
ncbi:MAG: hypothetical protein CMO80_11340 [Verrucomicrobiales bacterium]|nr:hypothetical protein [Verrucomicrobiales bacterium]|tara:strand:- start:151 stop:1266 length:1116 start_codon:yes stop_codon:yes gene_type:complete